MTKCEYIIENISMKELLWKYNFIFTRKGFMNCCFHNEKTPSACISKDDRWYKCFGCGVSYNTIDFVAHYENCSRKVAIDKINEMFNLGFGNSLTMQQKKELKEARLRNKIEKERQEKEKKEEILALNKIIKELRMWELIQKYSHPTRGNIRHNTWEFDDLFFYSLKMQRWLNWLYNKICEYDQPECEYDYKILDKKIELVKKIINNEIITII